MCTNKARKNGLKNFLVLAEKTQLYENHHEIEDFRSDYPDEEDYEAFLRMYTE